MSEITLLVCAASPVIGWLIGAWRANRISYALPLNRPIPARFINCTFTDSGHGIWIGPSRVRITGNKVISSPQLLHGEGKGG